MTRKRIVNAANWLVDHRADCRYSEASDRLYSLHRPYQTPFVSDCSSGVTCLYCWSNAPDPNQLGYRGGFTGTLIAAGHPVTRAEARSADIAILGPGTGWHAVLVIRGGADPLVWSMGEQGDPHLYPMSVVEQGVSYVNRVESCEVRYFRYDTRRLRETPQAFVERTLRNA